MSGLRRLIKKYRKANPKAIKEKGKDRTLKEKESPEAIRRALDRMIGLVALAIAGIDKQNDDA